MKDSVNYALKDVEKKYVKIIQNFKKGIQEVFGMKKMIKKQIILVFLKIKILPQIKFLKK